MVFFLFAACEYQETVMSLQLLTYGQTVKMPYDKLFQIMTQMKSRGQHKQISVGYWLAYIYMYNVDSLKHCVISLLFIYYFIFNNTGCLYYKIPIMCVKQKCSMI